MATIDTGAYTRNQPLANIGDNVAIFRVSLSVTLSSGDVHRIGKLPHGAIPVDAIYYPGAAAAAAQVIKFGTSASADMFFASASYSQAAAAIYRCTRKLGTTMQISLSDDAMPRYEAVTMTGTLAVSVGHIGDLILFYRMPGQTL